MKKIMVELLPLKGYFPSISPGGIMEGTQKLHFHTAGPGVIKKVHAQLSRA